MTPPDVLVIGAGPAGAVAALVLARAGVHVRLIDRARFPRHKLCGDTINPGARAILDTLGFRRPHMNAAALVLERALPIAGMTVTGPGGARVTAEYPHGLRGASLSRRDLDLMFVEAAVGAGVMFDEGMSARAPVMSAGRVTGTRVSWKSGEEVLHARVVIVADGRASRVASALGLSTLARRPRRWAFGAYFTGVEGLSALGEMHIRQDGYIGVAPLPGGIANVCVVRDAATGAQRRSLDQRCVIRDAIAAEPILRDRFSGARRVSEVAVLGPLAVESRASGAPGVLLAGDAAGFVDPMTGDGLRFALRGGVLAAQAAQRELTSGRASFEALHAARTREFSSKWRFNRALRALVSSPRALGLAASVADRWAAPVKYLIGVAGDVDAASSLGPQGSSVDPFGMAQGGRERSRAVDETRDAVPIPR